MIVVFDSSAENLSLLYYFISHASIEEIRRFGFTISESINIKVILDDMKKNFMDVGIVCKKPISINTIFKSDIISTLEGFER